MADRIAFALEHGHHLGERQAHHIGIRAHHLHHEGAGDSLDGIAARLPLPFAARQIRADLDLGRWLKGAYAMPGEPVEAVPDTEED